MQTVFCMSKNWSTLTSYGAYNWFDHLSCLRAILAGGLYYSASFGVRWFEFNSPLCFLFGYCLFPLPKPAYTDVPVWGVSLRVPSAGLSKYSVHKNWVQRHQGKCLLVVCMSSLGITVEFVHRNWTFGHICKWLGNMKSNWDERTHGNWVCCIDR